MALCCQTDTIKSEELNDDDDDDDNDNNNNNNNNNNNKLSSQIRVIRKLTVINMLKKFLCLFKKAFLIYLCFYGLFTNVVGTTGNVA